MSNANPTPTETVSKTRREDAAKRAERIAQIVEVGRANGHQMSFAARVAAQYAAVAKGGAR